MKKTPVPSRSIDLEPLATAMVAKFLANIDRQIVYNVAVGVSESRAKMFDDILVASLAAEMLNRMSVANAEAEADKILRDAYAESAAIRDKAERQINRCIAEMQSLITRNL